MNHCVLPEIVTGRQTSILLVGAGGTGGQILSGLARMNQTLTAMGHGGLNVTVVDGDTVSASNVGRQLYSPADVGANKATVQVTRMNNFFGTAWNAIPCYLETIRDAGRYSILIGAVDTAKARTMLAEYGTQSRIAYWLDTGNTAKTGQVVLGTFAEIKQPKKGFPEKLPHVLDLYGKIMAEEERQEYQGPSCSVEEAIEKQDLFVNQWVATAALEMLWKMFRKGYITTHGAFISLDPLSVRALPVDSEVWKAMGWAQKRRRKSKTQR